METANSSYLCGGTFFIQLLRARKELKSAQQHTQSIKESLSEPETFRRLLSIYQQSDFTPDKITLKSYTSNFKSCRSSLCSFTKFTDGDLRTAFDMAVRSGCSIALKMMSEFVEEFIDRNKAGMLVRCLLGIIKDDNTIDSEAEFFVQANGGSVKRKDICSQSEYCLETFLLGVWHYIIMNRPKENENGNATYLSWYSARSEYCGTVGNDITLQINIIPLPIETESVTADEITSSATLGDTDDDSDENVSFDEPQTSVQYIQNATIVNQYGNNNIHIDHLDILNL